MKADDGGDAVLAADAVQIGKNPLGRRRIEAGNGLVGEDDLRLLRHGAGDADTLLLAARQPVGTIKGAIEQTDPVDGRQGDMAVRPRGSAASEDSDPRLPRRPISTLRSTLSRPIR